MKSMQFLEFGRLAAMGLLAVGFLGGLFGCFGPAERKFPPGRCEVNEDCPNSGYRCADTWCEDIYHPRREIKNY